MLRRICFLAIALFGSLAASAAPVVLVCKSDSSTLVSYQIIFDEVTGIVSVDGGTGTRASISPTLITWKVPRAEEWHVDRTDGSWFRRRFAHDTFPEELEGGLCHVSTKQRRF